MKSYKFSSELGELTRKIEKVSNTKSTLCGRRKQLAVKLFLIMQNIVVNHPTLFDNYIRKWMISSIANIPSDNLLSIRNIKKKKAFRLEYVVYSEDEEFEIKFLFIPYDAIDNREAYIIRKSCEISINSETGKDRLKKALLKQKERMVYELAEIEKEIEDMDIGENK